MTLSKHQKQRRHRGALQQKLTCPDCGAASALEDLQTQRLPFIGECIECPRCSIGSAVERWRAGAAKGTKG